MTKPCPECSSYSYYFVGDGYWCARCNHTEESELRDAWRLEKVEAKRWLKPVAHCFLHETMVPPFGWTYKNSARPAWQLVDIMFMTRTFADIISMRTTESEVTE